MIRIMNNLNLIREGDIAIIRYQIVEMTKRAEEDGYMSDADRQIARALIDAYAAYGKNGIIDGYAARMHSLPMTKGGISNE